MCELQMLVPWQHRRDDDSPHLSASSNGIVRWVNAAGMITTPPTGGFSNGRAFYGRDTLRGKPIIARFVFSDCVRTRFTSNKLSPDNGKTWEVN